MRILALLLLVANVLFFTWRFNSQLADDLEARRRAPPLPPHAPSLTLLRELPELPTERVVEMPAAAEEAAAPAVAEAGVTSAGTAGATDVSQATDLAGTKPAEATSADVTTPDVTAGAPTATPLAETSGEASATHATEATPPTHDTSQVSTATTSGSGLAPESNTVTSAATAPADSHEASAADTPAAAGGQGDAASPATMATPEVTTSPAGETLASAKPEEVASSSNPPAPTPTPRVPSGTCLRAGPFDRDADLLPLKTWLAARSSQLTVKHEGGSQKPLFGIYLEPRSADEKEANLRDLAKRGVRDYLPVKRVGMDHAISLGVYSTQENVNRRLAEIEKQGYHAIVVPRRDAGGQRYLEAELDTGYEDPAHIPGKLIGTATVTTKRCGP